MSPPGVEWRPERARPRRVAPRPGRRCPRPSKQPFVRSRVRSGTRRSIPRGVSAKTLLLPSHYDAYRVQPGTSARSATTQLAHRYEEGEMAVSTELTLSVIPSPLTRPVLSGQVAPPGVGLRTYEARSV